jgi:hypothetical protein
MRSTSLIALVFALLLGIGCTDNGTQPGNDAGMGGDDAYVDDTGPPNDANVDAYRASPYVPHDAGYDDGGPGTAFTGANETWFGTAVDGAHCGNGSPLMVAVNLTTRSNDVVIYFQGGGACWDSSTCFGLGTASHVTDTLTAADVVDEATNGTSFLFERNAMNPYQNASYVYIPYCTGDAHAGNNVATYGTHTMHFEGAHNAELVFLRSIATWPSTAHVTLVGASAGGYGVLANWWRAQQIFSGARVDALSDSGLPLDVPSGRWRSMLTAWGFNLPPDCSGCDSIGDAMPYYASTMTPPHRFGLLAFLDDSVIPGFYGESVTAIHAGLLDLRTTTSATPNQRTFYTDMSGHVLMTTPDLAAGGVTVRQWVTQFATDDPAWGDVGP